MQLSAAKQTLAQLLGGMDQQLVVPPYQRPYAWEREQIDDLWDDVLSSLDGSHFMGSIVLNAENPSRPQVIDGQQRLTTMFLLVRVMQDHLRALGINDQADALYQLLYSNQFAKGDDRYRLRTGDASWPIFRDYVLRRHDDPARKSWGDASQESKAVRSRHRRFFQNALHLHDKLERWVEGLTPEQAAQRLSRLQNTMISGLEFVVVTVTSAPDAFLLFETLNDRGLQLSQADLLKNHLLSRVAGSDGSVAVQAAAADWDGLLDDLGRNADVTRFLRHYLLGKRFPVKKDQVFDRFKSEVAGSTPTALLTELRQYAAAYRQLTEPSVVTDDEELRIRLDALVTLRAESCYPLLLVAMRLLSRDEVLRVARVCEVLTFRYSSVCGFSATELQAAYHQAAKALLESEGDAVDDALQIIVRLVPDSDQFVSAFERQRMGAQYLARYALQGIEHAVNPGKEFKSNKEVHLEHILPQTPGDEWKQLLGDDLLDHTAYVQRWGNLTLLYGSENIGASNKLFAEKQSHYESSEVAMTKDLCRYTRWGVDVIAVRQRWLAEVADQVWSVESTDLVLPRPPLSIEDALSRLDADEIQRLASMLPDIANLDAESLSEAVQTYARSLGESAEANDIRANLERVLARWDELGRDGRRLVEGAVSYFLDPADARPDHGDGGLDDDLRVVRSVCEALLYEEPVRDVDVL